MTVTVPLPAGKYLANAALALLFAESQGLAAPVVLSLCKISFTEPSDRKSVGRERVF